MKMSGFPIVLLLAGVSWSSVGHSQVVSGKSYRIVSTCGTGTKVLGIEGDSLNDQASAVIVPKDAAKKSQVFKIESAGSSIRLTAEHSGKVLDVLRGSTASGAQIVQSTNRGTPSQLFRVRNPETGIYRFQNLNSALYLDLIGESTKTGNRFIQYISDASCAQRFKLEEVVAPQVPVVSANGTTVPPASRLVDAQGATWTIVDGIVYRNGATAGFTDQVTLLGYYGGRVHQRNIRNLWWYWSGTSWVSEADPTAAPLPTPTATPVPTPVPTPTPTPTPVPTAGSVFYGVNGHWVQGGRYTSVPLTTQKATLQDIGATLYRQDIYTVAQAQMVATNSAAMLPIKVLPVLIPSTDGAANEDAAYNSAFQLGQGSARVLMGKVPYYELSNERDNVCILPGRDGNKPNDYDNTCFLLNRGALRGLLAGLRSVDKTTPVIGGALAGWLHFGWADMLWNGTTPANATPDVSKQHRWDVTVWHWYSDMGDVTNACGGSGCFNTLNELKVRFGKPIMITEFNTRPYAGGGVSSSTPTEQQMADYLTTKMLPMWLNNAKTYNIIGINLYQLYSDAEGSYGLISGDGVTKLPKYDAYKRFIGVNPK